MKKILAVAATAAMTVMLMAGAGQALPISGALWNDDDAATRMASINPSLGSAGLGAPNATFTINTIDFDSQRGTDTYETFLQGDLLLNNNGLVWDLPYTDPLFDPTGFLTEGGWDGYIPGTGGKGSFFEFTGFAYFAENITINHDDGFWLQLGSLIFDSNSYPVYLDSTTLANAAGEYEFVLRYGAFNDFPEVLQVPIGNPVPEPSTMLLLGSGLLGLVALKRRRKA